MDALRDVERDFEPYTRAVRTYGPEDISADPRIDATAHEYCWGIRVPLERFEAVAAWMDRNARR